MSVASSRSSSSDSTRRGEAHDRRGQLLQLGLVGARPAPRSAPAGGDGRAQLVADHVHEPPPRQVERFQRGCDVLVRVHLAHAASTLRPADEAARHPSTTGVPVPSVWWNPSTQPEVPFPPEDRPGRAARAARDARARRGRDPLGRQGADVDGGRPPARSRSTTRRASRRTSRRRAASGSTRSPATCRSGARPSTGSPLDGDVDRPVTLDLADLRDRLPQTSMTRDFQCVTGWRVADVPWTGREARRPAHRRRRPRRRHPRAVLVVRRRLHRDPHPRAGHARRRARRPPHAGQARHPRARRTRAPLRGADVRLQVDQVARAHRGGERPRRARPTPATGRTSATTSMRGSGSPTASATRRRDRAVAAPVDSLAGRPRRALHRAPSGGSTGATPPCSSCCWPPA